MNNYSDAIRILANDNLDHKQMVFNIAMLHPKAIVEAYDQMLQARIRKADKANLTGWKKEAYDMAVAGADKITVIKRVREITSMGLREAKEAIEELVEESLWRRTA